jgi:hypothetical protein
MKIKLTKSELMALYTVFHSLVFQGNPTTMEIRLLQAILMGIYKKLHNKMVEVKKEYTLSLNVSEAISFWLFFNRCPLNQSELPFEVNLILKISNQIHQKFSV